MKKVQRVKIAVDEGKLLIRAMKRKLESNGSGLVDLVQRAYYGGFLHQHKALQEFLTDVINAVMGGRQSRVLSATSKEIYSTILYFCGQMAHDWVSKAVFLGPSIISTTRNIKATIDLPCVLGLHSTFFDVAARLIINAWGLIEVPFILSEDGSALQMRVYVDICSQGGEAHVFGFSGSSMTVKSLQEFTVMARDRTVASTLYAYTLVPLIAGAPSFPLFSIGHDGSSSTFRTLLAWSIWMYVWQELSARGVRFIGHTHDGDRRLVNAGHQLCRYPPDLYAESNSNVLIDETPQSLLPVQSRKARPAPIWLDHPVLPPYKIFAQTSGLRSFIHIMDNVDWLHTMWRVKNQFLQPHRRLDFGGLLITPSFLQRNKELLGLSDVDLDHENKQDMRGMEKVFDFCRQSAKSRPLGENDTMLQVPDYRKRPHVMVETDIVRENVRSSGAENYGLYMFLELFGHR
ncbi:hypothetical protein CEUSTIGMA_g13551.t1 [Chlamydomonas eustigma]|uniref:Uncharacterized protein n=1 Tax=Chlamydomonas eustigma TaxID=1157962 RepID=A0A250XSV6_9CHLO|nr:hypothetical protein CEUSTIGMA_g13551.t1 [Chlamydomonas eustigma]|eukprot:GAX86138.1 hypothetical protein CEUSTIGMA_g13551.t1 [Chlamydomonas eustigma]